MCSLKTELTPKDQETLLGLARESIEYGVEFNKRFSVNQSSYSEQLQQQAATFVTLRRNGKLRGCIGSIVAYQALVIDVVEKAHSAAFSDPRFPGLGEEELDGLVLQISILTPLSEIEFSSEQDLLEKIQAGLDGLVIDEGYNKGTFLPSMWEQLPDKEDFLRHLKVKAGLLPDYWSDAIRVSRFHSSCIADPDYYVEQLD